VIISEDAGALDEIVDASGRRIYLKVTLTYRCFSTTLLAAPTQFYS